MNLASILPPAAPATGTAAGTTTTDVPSGFLDVLTGKMGEQGGGAAAGEQGDDSSRTDAVTRQDVLTLAALASRTVHATMPVFTAAPTASTEPIVDAVPATGAALVDTEAAVNAASRPVADVPTADVPTSEVPVRDTAGAGGPVAAADATVPAGEQVRSTDTAAAAANPGDLVATARPGADHPVTTAAPAAPAAPAAAQAIAPDAATTTPVPDGAATADVAATAVPTGGTTSDTPTATGATSTPAAATAGATTAAADASTTTPDTAATAATTDRQATTVGLGTDRAVAADRPRVRTDAAAPTTTTDANPVSATDAAEVNAPTAPTAGTVGRTSLLAPSAAAQRVLDIVEQLEDAPPPRVMVIETGEIRVRVGLDAGTVRLTVLGQLTESGEEVLREAADALEAGGFGTELDRSSSGDTEDAEPDPWHVGAPLPTGDAAPGTPTSSRQRAGLQL